MTKHRERRIEAPPPSIAGRVPPHDLTSEAATLSTVLLEANAIDVVSSIMRPEDHYSDPNRMILEAAVDLRKNNQPIDVVTVAAWLRHREKLAAVGGSAYLAQIVDATPAVLHVEAHAQTVAELARLRRTIAVLQRLGAEAYFADARADISAWIAGAVEQVLAVATTGRSVRRGITSEDFFARFFVDKSEDDGTPPDAPPLIFSGIRSLDRTFGPIQGGENEGVLAYSGCGKSAYCSSLAANLISVAYRARCTSEECNFNGINPGLSTSTPASLLHCPICRRACLCQGDRVQAGCTGSRLIGTVPQGVYIWTGSDIQHAMYLARIAARFAGCSARKVLSVLRGTAPERAAETAADADLLRRISGAVHLVRSRYLRIVDDATMTIEDIVDDMIATSHAYAKDGVELRLAIGDYFQDIQTRDPMSLFGGREGQLTHVSQTWTRGVKRARVAGLFPAQPNDEARNAGRPPIARDVRWSRSWEQGADIVLSIDNPSADARWMKDVENTDAEASNDYGERDVILPPDPVRLILSKYRGNRTGYVRAAFHPTSTTFADWDPSYGDWQEQYRDFDRQRQQGRKRDGNNKGRAD